MAVAIKVENLSKAYQLGEFSTGTLSRDIERWWYKMRGKEDPFIKIGQVNHIANKGMGDIVWSLKEVNFEIEKGDAIGIIGRNGAGKSTLLKILSRITAPTSGKVKVRGRIASLLEVGTGFHPELTGKENIYLNGTMLGMHKREIKEKFDEIVDFAGVERYLDTPVKRYSSGMYVRLAFAVAAHLESEILIVDEVLAVGDAEFQKKCIGKMGEVSKEEGRTVLFVSHNMASIEALCNIGIFFEGGNMIFNGNIKNTINKYISINLENVTVPLAERKDREGFGNIKLTKVYIDAPNGVFTGKDFQVYATYTTSLSEKEIAVSEFGMSIWTDQEVKLISISTTFKNELIPNNIPTSGTICCKIEDLPLTQGLYILNFFVSSQHGIEDYIVNCLTLEVENSNYYGSGKIVDSKYGVIAVKHNWSLK